jgi:aspartyl-tRNA(Asn)/glutamyl-tRNA(Gln) amidotransferase subunit A
MKSLLETSLVGASTNLRDGKVKAAALADAAISAYESVGSGLDAYREWRPELLKAQAAAADTALTSGAHLGPLHGVPVSLKDLYGAAGYQTFAGTPAPLPAAWELDGSIVSRLRRQLAPFTGKTHTVELAFGGLGANPHWPVPRNPWDAKDHRVPGGSSSGAGVTIQSGTALLALGTDTAGSIRLPASATGSVGIKASFGRWAADRIVPLSPNLDTPGIIARTMDDLVFAFAAIDPWSEANPYATYARLQDFDLYGVRIGVPEGLQWEHCSPGVAEAVQESLKALEKAGTRLVSMKLPEADAVWPLFRKGGIQGVELLHFLKTELPGWLDKIDPTVRQRMEDAETLPAHEYLERRRLIRELSSQAEQHFSRVDLMAGPTIALTPPKLADVQKIDDYRQANILTLRNTAFANFLGLCAVTLPVGLDAAKMPVGLHLMARGSDDPRLLAMALACEKILGTAAERLGKPPLAPK